MPDNQPLKSTQYDEVNEWLVARGWRSWPDHQHDRTRIADEWTWRGTEGPRWREPTRIRHDGQEYVVFYAEHAAISTDEHFLVEGVETFEQLKQHIGRIETWL